MPVLLRMLLLKLPLMHCKAVSPACHNSQISYSTFILCTTVKCRSHAALQTQQCLSVCTQEAALCIIVCFPDHGQGCVVPSKPTKAVHAKAEQGTFCQRPWSTVLLHWHLHRQAVSHSCGVVDCAGRCGDAVGHHHAGSGHRLLHKWVGGHVCHLSAGLWVWGRRYTLTLLSCCCGIHKL